MTFEDACRIARERSERENGARMCVWRRGTDYVVRPIYDGPPPLGDCSLVRTLPESWGSGGVVQGEFRDPYPIIYPGEFVLSHKSPGFKGAREAFKRLDPQEVSQRRVPFVQVEITDLPPHVYRDLARRARYPGCDVMCVYDPAEQEYYYQDREGSDVTWKRIQ